MYLLMGFSAALMCSLVSSLVKVALKMVTSDVVAFSRLFFGTLTILLICLIISRKPKLHVKNAWIWVATGTKLLNYFCENYALRNGAAYGNIISVPVQTITVCLFSVLLFKEKIGPRKLISILLCIAGILMISWNGRPMGTMDSVSLETTILYIFSGIGAGGFIMAQKMMVDEVEPLDMNLAVFLFGAMFAFVPVSLNFQGFPEFRADSVLALLALGVITGVALVLLAKSMKKLSLLMAGITQASTPFFILMWAAILWHDKLGVYVIGGTILFFIGLLLINIAPKKGIFVN